MFVQEISAVPVASPVIRVLQPMDVEQVLDVPALHIDEDDSILNEFLELVALQETPEVQASSSAAMVVQEQVIVQPLPEARVPRQRVHQRTVEQVANSRVPPAPCGIVEQMVDVSVPGRSSSVASERNVERMVDVPVRSRISSVVPERIVEQVMDVPVSRGVLSTRTRAAEYWLVSCCAGRLAGAKTRGFSHFFPRTKKCEGCPPVDSGTGAAPQLMDAGGL